MEASVTEVGFSAMIKLNPVHIVFSGHFPGHPVTPGVIQMQIVHELLEEYVCQPLKLNTMDRCKFLKILNPEETDRLVVSAEWSKINGLLQVKARGESNALVFFKMEAVYRLG